MKVMYAGTAEAFPVIGMKAMGALHATARRFSAARHGMHIIIINMIWPFII